MTDLKYSIIVPVYNRPNEVQELMESLSLLEYRNFEVIIVEDGSTDTCKMQVDHYQQMMDLQYFFRANSGPGDSRNFGATKASGDYLIFFDSDCLIPSNYLTVVNEYLLRNPLNVFGGPDRAHPDFSEVQKAISYAMTSFLTTGGIRGHRNAASRFQPRSFNMGVGRQVFSKIGGFANLHPGEDPDLVYRLSKQGYTIGLISEAFVYHKRRIDFNKFSNQVYKFGLARTILMKWHPDSRKIVFWLPTIFLIVGIVLLVIGFQQSYAWWAVLIGLLVILIDAIRTTRSISTAMLGTVATMVQVVSYGWGFGKGWWYLHLLGKDPKIQFPGMFKGP